MKTYVVLLVLWLGCGWISLQAQTISGRVTSEGSVVPGAQVLVKAQQSGLVRQFTSTSPSGIFSIHVKNEHLPALLEIKAIGYEPWQLPVDSLTHDISGLEVKLVPQPLELSEVVVKAERAPVAVKEDTVIYNVQSFKDGTERVIEDLLKKLPGVEVNDNGTIKFKGKAISKLLLDGDDLFGHNYTIGSKNLDVDIVEEVQGVDKFSENPLLKGIVSSDEVALNLVLKKGKADLSGNADLGYGVSERYNAGATLLRVTSNFKSFALSKYNNTGLNNSPFNAATDNIMPSTPADLKLLSPKIISGGSFYSPLDDARSRLNSSFYSSFNATLRAFKNVTAKVNIGYYADELQRHNLVASDYSFEDIEFQTRQSERLKKLPRLFHGQAELTYKPSENTLVVYQGHINYYKSTSGIAALDNDRAIETTVGTNDLLVKQNLDVTRRLNDKAALKFSALYSYNKAPQYLLSDQHFPFLTAEDTDPVTRQTSRHQKQYVEVQSTLYRKLRKNELEIAGGVQAIRNNYLSFMEVNGEKQEPGEATLTNDTRYTTTAPFLELSYQFSLGKLKVKPSARLEYLMRSFSGAVANSTETKKALLLHPGLNVSYKVGEHALLYAAYTYEQEPSPEDRMFQGLVINSYRSVTNNVVSMHLLNTRTATIGYNINDFYNLFNLSVSGSYISEGRNYLLYHDISKNFNQVTFFLSDAGNETYYLSQMVSKYIHFLRTTFKFNATQGILNYQNMVNSTELRSNESQFLIFELFAKTGFDAKLNFENKYSYQVNKVSSANYSASSAGLKNKFRVLYDPAKKWKITTDLHHFIPDLDGATGTYLFVDAGVTYALPNKKALFKLSGVNLTNNRTFNELSISDYATTVRSQNLISRYVMLSANIKL